MDVLTVERVADHVALVTMRRPETRNAVDVAMAEAMDRTVKRIEADPDIWIVVLTGEGTQAFSAGADLKEVAAGRLDDLYTVDGQFAGFVKHPRQKLWIAAVEGYALAGGCEIALACDMIVASDSAIFSLPEVKRGLVAGAGGIYRLARTLPRNIAIEMVATGGRLPAERACHLGMVNRLVRDGEAVAEAVLLAGEITANAPLAVRESVAVTRQALDLDDDTLFELGLEAQRRMMRTDDFQEGPRAFLEKRPPNWQGR
ncbi:enoyl-CoA hydratase [Sphingomonas ginkgonis]|uniref:Enoyl-CoA hydratase n=1 Tax=Sphingomonas ginkgonis TaxID=2315330 RepID=A0A3R9X9M0_9SPHN|nr:enoyl-CoA hydratase-related protein [Sphingomonas ginkgonis]RST31991.1 enoyl-CoA hydratase [Sphingomonas ginkgonis]